MNVLILESNYISNKMIQNFLLSYEIFNIDTVDSHFENFLSLSKKNYDFIFIELSNNLLFNIKNIQLIEKNHKSSNVIFITSYQNTIIENITLIAKNYNLNVLDKIERPSLSVKLNSEKLKKIIEKKSKRNYKLDFTLCEIKEALKNENIQIWFQPKINIKHSKIDGAEALVRWIHPKYGLLLAGQIMPFINYFSLNKELLLVALKFTFKAQIRWLASGHFIKTSINLPTFLLEDEDFINQVELVVKSANIDPKMITFEILESNTPFSLGKYYASAWNLRMKGFGLAQDDFGTGYSSYANLSATPFTEIKIDKSFVSNCLVNEKKKEILTSIVKLGKSLNLTVVAEGVENKEEVLFLKILGCDQVQGFYYYPAMTYIEFDKILNSNSLSNPIN
ncbi:EAL domain-containing protein [Acinetobacter sp. V89_7]|uniref:EAL domain-containing protein n=1 Tax=Acinetobacter sp. V89_7 TaxID=3044233 RepID=UPI00249E9FA7|nr:EAL domain-containing protein [Acinetobacter sp. V89_7]MDI3379613.1 EAL domain-containing protein [Acinetobacter sp. V89_7]